MTWVASLAVTRNVEQQRGKHKLWDISHWAFQLGGNAACLFPKMIQQESGSGKGMGDVVLLFLERFQILPASETPGPDRLHTRSEGTTLPLLWPEGS